MLPIYRVLVRDEGGSPNYAFLKPSTYENMVGDWSCNWPNLWNTAYFDCEAVIELSFEDVAVGLMKFGLYPYPYDNGIPKYLHILNIETVQGNTRLCNPIGFWLIWYAVQIAFFFCDGDSSGSLVTLDAYERQGFYYRDKVKMECIGETTLAPGEDGYAFRFTEERAMAFSERLEDQFGFPVQLGLE